MFPPDPALWRPASALLAALLLFAPWSKQWLSYFWFQADLPWQIWRLITAHLSHWSWPHWGMNALAALLFLWLYQRHYAGKTLLLISLWLVLCCDLYLLSAYQRPFYLGLSAVLYGLFSFAALQRLRHEPWVSILVLAAILLKTGQGTSSADLIGLPVATDMHWVAILAGSLAALLSYCYRPHR